jgi:TonB family protein
MSFGTRQRIDGKDSPMKKALVLIILLTSLSASAQITNRWLTRPALVGAGPKALTSLLHYPEAEALAKREMEVVFFCDISQEGKATDFLLSRPADPSNVFVVAVRKALGAATFEPAVLQGVPVGVQIPATVAFEIQNGWPTTVVRLNASDKSASERDYIGPQLIGGSAALLQNVAYPAIARAQHVNGYVDLAFEIDIFGSPRGIHVVNEKPTAHGFGESAIAAMNKARFIPALYHDHALKAPVTQRIEFNLEVIERYAPAKPSKKKN